jgi:hypothetical protein
MKQYLIEVTGYPPVTKRKDKVFIVLDNIELAFTAAINYKLPGSKLKKFDRITNIAVIADTTNNLSII